MISPSSYFLVANTPFPLPPPASSLTSTPWPELPINYSTSEQLQLQAGACANRTLTCRCRYYRFIVSFSDTTRDAGQQGVLRISVHTTECTGSQGPGSHEHDTTKQMNRCSTLHRHCTADNAMLHQTSAAGDCTPKPQGVDEP